MLPVSHPQAVPERLPLVQVKLTLVPLYPVCPHVAVVVCPSVIVDGVEIPTLDAVEQSIEQPLGVIVPVVHDPFATESRLIFMENFLAM